MIHLQRCLIMTGTLALLMAPAASAKSVTYAPYEGYEYNAYGESAAAPAGYVQSGYFSSADMGLEQALQTPMDMLMRDGSLYILDSGGSRVVRLNADYKADKIFAGFTDETGAPVDFTNAKGMTIGPDGSFYIADTDHERILVFSAQGKLLREILRPDIALEGTDTPFRATKLLLDRKNRLYALVESVNTGAFIFSPEGEFVSYFGSNPVRKTSAVLLDFFRKRFLTKEQKRKILLHTPVTFSGFDADPEGFVYTVTPNTQPVPDAGLVRKLNYLGSDILQSQYGDIVFGDLEWDRQLPGKKTTFLDIDVDEQGYMNLLDAGRGKIFQYTQEGYLVSVFGGYGKQSGMFTSPRAVESDGEKILVLDEAENALFVFSPTGYAKELRKAFQMLDTSDTDASLEQWSRIMRMNSNSQYTYYGVGLSLDAQGKYKEAMDAFRLSDSKGAYSKAFQEYRKAFVKENYFWLLPLLAAVLVSAVLFARALRRQFAAVRGSAFTAAESKYAFPLYTALHPADGFEQFKTRKIQSYRLSALLVFVWFLLAAGTFYAEGFIFNRNRPADFNLLATFTSTVGLFLLFAAANWSVCTLLGGKGTLKEITAVAAYSLLPYLCAMLLVLILSNLLTAQEAAFLDIIRNIGLLWSCLILVVGLQTVHQYSLLQTVGSVILTVVGIVVIAVLIILFYTLMQQMVNFIRSLVSEFRLR